MAKDSKTRLNSLMNFLPYNSEEHNLESITNLRRNINYYRDIYGPFPDETITDFVDRMLHYFEISEEDVYEFLSIYPPTYNSVSLISNTNSSENDNKTSELMFIRRKIHQEENSEIDEINENEEFSMMQPLTDYESIFSATESSYNSAKEEEKEVTTSSIDPKDTESETEVAIQQKSDGGSVKSSLKTKSVTFSDIVETIPRTPSLTSFESEETEKKPMKVTEVVLKKKSKHIKSEDTKNEPVKVEHLVVEKNSKHIKPEESKEELIKVEQLIINEKNSKQKKSRKSKKEPVKVEEVFTEKKPRHVELEETKSKLIETEQKLSEEKQTNAKKNKVAEEIKIIHNKNGKSKLRFKKSALLKSDSSTFSAAGENDSEFKKRKKLTKVKTKPKLIGTRWALSKVSFFDNSSRTFEIMNLEKEIPEGVYPKECRVIFAVLPNGASVCFECLGKIKQE